MLKVGDRAIVRTDEGGHFYKGKHVVVLQVLSPNTIDPILVRAENGVTESWYSADDLEEVSENG